LINFLAETLKNTWQQDLSTKHQKDKQEQLMNRPVVHLTNEPFYQEIDQLLASIVQPNQMKFV
jgi:hypothetical protein